jgi:CheY-like chemotaxis protein
VDDEPDARNLIQRVLQDSHATVVTAASADEAVELLEREAPDVLISDIGMPGEDGYSLIRRVRLLPGAIAKVPAIALTAYARTEDRVKAIHAGFQLHLSKPVEAIELIAMVESLMRRPPPSS